jgi:hypothetical protein
MVNIYQNCVTRYQLGLVSFPYEYFFSCTNFCLTPLDRFNKWFFTIHSGMELFSKLQKMKITAIIHSIISHFFFQGNNIYGLINHKCRSNFYTI